MSAWLVARGNKRIQRSVAMMGQRDIFADAFNFYLYGGRQVLHPEQLRELDSTELSYPFGADGRGEPVQKYRDVLKSAVFMEDGNRRARNPVYGAGLSRPFGGTGESFAGGTEAVSYVLEKCFRIYQIFKGQRRNENLA